MDTKLRRSNVGTPAQGTSCDSTSESTLVGSRGWMLCVRAMQVKPISKSIVLRIADARRVWSDGVRDEMMVAQSDDERRSMAVSTDCPPVRELGNHLPQQSDSTNLVVTRCTSNRIRRHAATNRSLGRGASTNHIGRRALEADQHGYQTAGQRKQHRIRISDAFGAICGDNATCATFVLRSHDIMSVQGFASQASDVALANDVMACYVGLGTLKLKPVRSDLNTCDEIKVVCCCTEACKHKTRDESEFDREGRLLNTAFTGMIVRRASRFHKNNVYRSCQDRHRASTYLISFRNSPVRGQFFRPKPRSSGEETQKQRYAGEVDRSGQVALETPPAVISGSSVNSVHMYILDPRARIARLDHFASRGSRCRTRVCVPAVCPLGVSVVRRNIVASTARERTTS
ncbi:oxidoreductase [Pseudozyma hubeiensis SY62]|uniref:Oxidoreductase n=1 Tax=Pseudozyma hubeiensis (strain SY62) TaxID=1305764 RepID=R9P918_PSEHS|nr:oxidoreductase [Pseudozyma hubeiensis SY62]GAC97846.1 oxidoreductase [Pseudozyma hubeiensis SY62]